LLSSLVSCLIAATVSSTPGPRRSSGVSPGQSTVATAVRALRAPIIDGKDDDAIWRTAPVTTAFREFQPVENADPRFRTELKVAYDDHDLYVFVRAFDPHPDSIMHALTRRDVRGPSDQIILLIDGYDDRRTGYDLDVNPDGVKRDYAVYADGNEDDSWDGVWRVATRVDSLGWTAEFAIPFSQIRYAQAKTHTFGFGVWRDIERYKERVAWPAYYPSKNGFFSQLGELTGISNIAAPHTTELTPYVVAKNSSRATTSGYDRRQQETVGADLKYGVTSHLTLDGTVNPDFGQVEADPAVLNLSAFETFFPEKRPFFIEGSGLYQFGLNCNAVNCANEGLFYSRRIGRSPQLLDSYGDADSPTATPILAAGKLTGRLASGLALGVLDASTAQVDGAEQRTIEPATNYAVVRAEQDLSDGQSGFGFIGTAVDRRLDGWTADSLRRAAYIVGADFRHRFWANQYEVSGSLTESRVEGTPSAIAQTQLDPVHDYQRPDGGLRVDSTRTSLMGNTEELLFGKYGGGITHFQTSYQRQSAGFEPNDLGFLERADEQNVNTWAALIFHTPHGIYNSLQINGNQWDSWTASGLRLEDAFNTNAHLTFTNNWSLGVGGTYNQVGNTFCDLCARGGPALRNSPRIAPWLQFSGDDRWSVIPSLWLNFARGEGGRGSYAEVNPSVDMHAGTRAELTLGVDASHNIDDEQWYGNFLDSIGTHYAFAHLDQRTLSITTELNYTVTPTLTAEVYGQPFVSTGQYTRVRQLSATPRADSYDDRFAPYALPAGSSTGFDNWQLQTNFVVRWEYRPGSTLFFVWTHGRDGSSDYTGQSWSGQYHDLFALHPDNTFLIKVAYWMNR
jgi:hypothetical protein